MEPKTEERCPVTSHSHGEVLLDGSTVRIFATSATLLLVDAVFTMPPPLRVAILLVLAPAFAAGMTMRMVPPARVDAAITGSSAASTRRATIPTDERENE